MGRVLTGAHGTSKWWKVSTLHGGWVVGHTVPSPWAGRSCNGNTNGPPPHMGRGGRTGHGTEFRQTKCNEDLHFRDRHTDADISGQTLREEVDLCTALRPSLSFKVLNSEVQLYPPLCVWGGAAPRDQRRKCRREKESLWEEKPDARSGSEGQGHMRPGTPTGCAVMVCGPLPNAYFPSQRENIPGTFSRPEPTRQADSHRQGGTEGPPRTGWPKCHGGPGGKT